MRRNWLLVLSLMLAFILTACNKAEDVVVIEDDKPAEALEEDVWEELAEKVGSKEYNNKTCEEFYFDKVQDINAGLKEELSLATSVFKDASFEVEGNNIVYTYTFSELFGGDPESLKSQDYSDLIENTKEAIYVECGVKPETVTFRYYLASGEKIYEITK